jgi:hypothetical protein
VRQRRANSTGRGELRDEDHGLLDDGVDEQIGIHGP